MVNKKDKKKFAVCIAPLYGPYNSTADLIQWIEMNRILGADYFVFYNFSTSRHIDSILNFYSRKRLAEVAPWNISQFPSGSENEMHYLGQHAAMNDCLMRVKNISEFVVNCDLDEVIVPHSNLTTWLDVTKRLPNNGGYLFKSSFFRFNWENIENDFPEKAIAEKYGLIFLFKLRRENNTFPAGVRSKYISRTNVTRVMGTHVVFEMMPGYRTHDVPAHIGLLHHYRTVLVKVAGEFIPDPNNTVASFIDDTVYVRYRNKLIRHVMAVYSEMNMMDANNK